MFLTRLNKAGDSDSARAVMQLLEAKIPLCFRFLAHADDDVSAAVMDFAREYVQVLIYYLKLKAIFIYSGYCAVVEAEGLDERNGTPADRKSFIHHL